MTDKKVLLYFLVAINIGYITGNSQNFWFHNLKDYISNNAHLFPTVLALDTDYKAYSSEYNKFVDSFTIEIPWSTILPIQYTPHTELVILNHLLTAELAAIVVNMDNYSESTYEAYFDKIGQFSVDYLDKHRIMQPRPKLLVLFWEGSLRAPFEWFLDILWKFNYLDVTILVVKKEINWNCTVWDITYTNIEIHQRNPFIKKYTRQHYSSDIIWFPDKLQDMQGYPIRAGTHNNQYLPFSEFISKAMNATLRLVKYTQDVEGLKVMYRDMDLGRLDFEQTPLLHISKSAFHNPGYFFYQMLYTLPIMTPGYCIGIPITYLENVTVHPSGIPLFIVSFLVVILIKVGANVRKLQITDLKFIDMWHMALSNSVVRQPKSLIEKVLFCAFFVESFLYTSEILGSVVKISVDERPVRNIDTLEQLNKSGLWIIGCGTDIENSIYNFSNIPAAVKLAQKTIDKSSILSQDWRKVIYHRNVSILLTNRGRMAVEYTNNRYGMEVVRCLSDRMIGTFNLIALAKHSFYMERFNDLRIWFLEVGLFKYDPLRYADSLYLDFDRLFDSLDNIGFNSSSKNSDEFSEIIRALFFAFIAVIFCISIPSFLLEVFIGYYEEPLTETYENISYQLRILMRKIFRKSRKKQIKKSNRKTRKSRQKS